MTLLIRVFSGKILVKPNGAYQCICIKKGVATPFDYRRLAEAFNDDKHYVIISCYLSTSVNDGDTTVKYDRSLHGVSKRLKTQNKTLKH